MTDSEWTALLDGFERDLDGSSDVLESWVPPVKPLPAELADRARGVLRRQEERIARTRDELDEVRQQLDALRRVPAARRADAPAYLDVNG
jgi:hypothetical protein